MRALSHTIILCSVQDTEEVTILLKRRQQEIREKGFSLVYSDENEEMPVHDYSKMRVGMRTVDNALVNLGSYKKVNPNYGDKSFVLNAIYRHDYKTLREISEYFFESSGIYYRLCKYLATIYRYDWYVTPYIDNVEKEKEQKVLSDFSKVLLYVDRSDVKRMCGNIALDIMKDGVYYGIVVDFGDRFSLQKLPASYCRNRFYSGVDPIVELNLQFFDNYFPNVQQRIKILNIFPKEIQHAYVLFKQGKLKGDYPGDPSCWYALDPATSVKLCLNDNCFPPLVGTIPSIIDLDQAQELDRQKTMQQLLKIIIQKLPMDKNGDLIFDVDEARDIHNNAVAMLRRAIGIDVLTTFADIEKIDTKDSNSSTTTDDLEKVERTVFNNAGISRNLFNADGNLAVTNAILTDEASIREIPLQFAALLNKIISRFNKKNHYEFRVSILETTQFNYKDLAKIYKEQAQMGYSKMLPQVALGHSQSSVLATLTFENEILHLSEIMIPPMMSSTMSGNMVKKDQDDQNKTQNNQTSSKVMTEEKQTGRPEKEDQEKSDKTIQNREAMT